jgi:TonB family protein
MRYSFLTLFLSLMLNMGFAQNPSFSYEGRFTPTANKTVLNEALTPVDLMPELYNRIAMPFQDQQTLQEMRYWRLEHFPQEYYVSTGNDYSKFMDFETIEISGICAGKTISASGSAKVLTSEQKNLLQTADYGTDIRIKISMRLINQDNKFDIDPAKTIEGTYVFTVVPEAEAECPGGFKQLSAYYTENVHKLFPDPLSNEKIRQAIVTFTIAENGQVINPELKNSTSDPAIDAALLNATKNMPSWKPAATAEGVKVKQSFCIPFGGGC